MENTFSLTIDPIDRFRIFYITIGREFFRITFSIAFTRAFLVLLVYADEVTQLEITRKTFDSFRRQRITFSTSWTGNSVQMRCWARTG